MRRFFIHLLGGLTKQESARAAFLMGQGVFYESNRQAYRDIMEHLKAAGLVCEGVYEHVVDKYGEYDDLMDKFTKGLSNGEEEKSNEQS